MRPFLQQHRNALIACVLALLFLGGLLFADLRSQGLVWRFLYNQTGEESLVGQVRGFVELLGNLIRPQPNTQPLTPIQHTDSPPYGMNVFLQKEVEEPKIRAMLQMIQEAGFVWLRQEFPWEDLEIDGRGQFTDSRNDLNGDGVKDTQDAWAKYDRIVALTEEYGFRMMVRLSNPPDWAIADTPDIGTFAPPNDLQDYVNYAVAVASRYKGRITHYQIWNEPNIYPEWGEQFADPVAYTDMLCRTYRALKQIDPNIVVISAAIAPTISLDGFMGYQDVVYLQNMYDAGASGCFDVLAAQGYGLFSGAMDRRLRLTTVNVARHTYYRDLMIANGDAEKPIWISEAAWNAVEDAELPPDQIVQYDRFGLATQAQASRYMPQLYQRAQEEWSWVGVVFYWFFTRPDPFEANQSFYYFRMVEPDYSPEKPTFTPLPVYDSMKTYITTQTPTLYRGVHQAESWKIVSARVLMNDPNAQFERAIESDSVSFVASGTDIWLRLKSSEDVTVTIGTESIVLAGSDDWRTVRVMTNTLPQTVNMTLDSDAPFLLDSVMVEDNTWNNVGVLLVLSGLLGGAVVVLVVVGVKTRLNNR
jgi:hypothetical protein